MMRSYVVVHGKTENDSGLGSHVCVCVCNMYVCTINYDHFTRTRTIFLYFFFISIFVVFQIRLLGWVERAERGDKSIWKLEGANIEN